jgi:hypothetical protein
MADMGHSGSLVNLLRSMFPKVGVSIRAFIVGLLVCTMGMLILVGTANSGEIIQEHPTIEESEEDAKIGAIVGYGFVKAPWAEFCSSVEVKTSVPFDLPNFIVANSIPAAGIA